MTGYTTSAGGDEYNARATALTRKIGELHLLRSAQRSESDHERMFQREIDDLTTELVALRNNIPDLRKLDETIVRAARAATFAEIDAHHIGLGRIAGSGLVALTGLVVLVVSVASWGPIPAMVGLLLLALGGVGLTLMARSRRMDTDNWHDALDRHEALRQQRADLLEGVTATTHERERLAIEPPRDASGVFAEAVRATRE